MRFWQYLYDNYQQLQVVLTFVGVVVAAAGVWVAWKYVKVTRELAVAARDQSLAARDQANVTRGAFEAGDRPYLEPQLGGFYFLSPESYLFRFSLTNHGHVPATLVGWRVEVRIAGELSWEIPLSSAEQAVFPGTTEGFSARKESPGAHPTIEAPLQLI